MGNTKIRELINKAKGLQEKGFSYKEIESAFPRNDFAFLKNYLIRRNKVEKVSYKLMLYRQSHDESLPVARENRNALLFSCFLQDSERLMRADTKAVFSDFYRISGDLYASDGKPLVDEDTLSLAKDILSLDIAMSNTCKNMDEIMLSFKSSSFHDEEVTVSVYHSDSIVSGTNRGKIKAKLDIYTKKEDIKLQDNDFLFCVLEKRGKENARYNYLPYIPLTSVSFSQEESAFVNLLLEGLMKKISEKNQFVDKMRESLVEENCCFVSISALSKYAVVENKEFDSPSSAREFIRQASLDNLAIPKDIWDKIAEENVAVWNISFSFAIKDSNGVGIYNASKEDILLYIDDYFGRPDAFLAREEAEEVPVNGMDIRNEKEILNALKDSQREIVPHSQTERQTQKNIHHTR